MRQVPRGLLDTAQHAVDQRELHGRRDDAHVDERRHRLDMPHVETLALGLHPRLVHPLEEEDDVVEVVLEHEVEDEAPSLR